mmetsp:Transcript_19034/g.76469  ORF Transcript_19034/g.76469 Transcript_19034/m.76469 type:complete len:104 (-) Transcript_19034:928-1239(-)
MSTRPVTAENIISLPRKKLIFEAHSALEIYTAGKVTIGELMVPELGDVLISHESRESFVSEVRLIDDTLNAVRWQPHILNSRTGTDVERHSDRSAKTEHWNAD